MSVVLHADKESGRCNCDARCYDAKPSKRNAKCNCVCGGKNHGKGWNFAIDTLDYTPEGYVMAVAAHTREQLRKSRQSQGVMFDGVKPFPGRRRRRPCSIG